MYNEQPREMIWFFVCRDARDWPLCESLFIWFSMFAEHGSVADNSHRPRSDNIITVSVLFQSHVKKINFQLLTGDPYRNAVDKLCFEEKEIATQTFFFFLALLFVHTREFFFTCSLIARKLLLSLPSASFRSWHALYLPFVWRNSSSCDANKICVTRSFTHKRLSNWFVLHKHVVCVSFYFPRVLTSFSSSTSSSSSEPCKDAAGVVCREDDGDGGSLIGLG